MIQVNEKETSIVPRDEMQNGGFIQAQSIIFSSKKLQDDLHAIGLKIKQHEDNVKLLKSQRNKLEDSILDMQVILGKYHASTPPDTENTHNSNQSEEEIIEQILRHEMSAAALFYQLRVRHGSDASDASCTNDVLGVVATLGRVDDDNLSRLLAEYIGVESMLAIVCKTYEGLRALETYDKEGHIDSGGLHGLGSTIGRALDGRFLAICLDNIRPYCGEFLADDPQRRLDLLKPKLPDGECPPGFIGFAVNMISVDVTNLFYVTSSGYGLRETLFYNLFSRLQVYKSREEMFRALPCISNGAISLDGGIIRTTGHFSLGKQNNVDVRFPKPSSNPPDIYLETEKQLKEVTWKKEKMTQDIKREQSLWNAAKYNFERKKEEFVKFLAETSAYATQVAEKLQRAFFRLSQALADRDCPFRTCFVVGKQSVASVNLVHFLFPLFQPNSSVHVFRFFCLSEAVKFVTFLL
ncbi:protein DEFECTIVE IN MERISTEM SILENCING 3-like isoform X2 [Mercurialis annua]|nr:protein DEFECTIVE IN MERISTEM SILENCING 3-like isoform X2 [Mercurialis annua]XP_050237480.1 protein DEFECTIVE IN MERISTEM SILENCING 3-like isoform X2 [Mercurialis annua]XP_050237481.1 protein DEFECTIVE IN MERISTEM SILENCING 3-like isoform X2 [Mercurialis annua]XP_050237482.1 protein DEFECTIVE IN MERISTEM SILENCING 3-like isoform X2 [Mercurialis annua]